MADEQLTDKIEAWLQGRLPAAEAAVFQAEVAADPALAEEVELHRLTLRAMEHLSEQHLQQNVLAWIKNVPMEDLEDEPDQKPELPVHSFNYRNWFWAAAALLVLTGAFLFDQIRQDDAETQKIIALEAEIQRQENQILQERQRPVANPAAMDSLVRQSEILRQELAEIRRGIGRTASKPPDLFAYYEKPNSRVRGRAEGSSAETYLKEGFVAFEQSNLKEAEAKARAALSVENGSRDAHHLLAHALFGQRRFIEAEAEFAWLLRPKEGYAPGINEYYEAEWNRLLCYRNLSVVDDGQRALFHAALDAISKNPRHPKHTRAAQMKTGELF